MRITLNNCTHLFLRYLVAVSFLHTPFVINKFSESSGAPCLSFGKNYQINCELDTTYRGFKSFCSIIFFFLSTTCFSQNTLSLEQVIGLAQKQSPYYHRAKNTYERSYWQFANFKARFKPQIRLAATVPTFYRAINPITQPDGTIEFIRVSQANNSVGINLVQNIGFTGGILSAGTSLQRTDNFSGNQSSYFLSSPFRLSYIQSSLLYNDAIWQRKIEPLLFETAEKGFSEEMEITALEAAKLFFEGLQAQVAVDISNTNLANSDTLFRLSKERFSIGTIMRTDLLQLEVNLLKAQNQLTQDKILKEASIRNLKRILGFSQDETLILTPPVKILAPNITYELALEQAQLNRKAILEFKSQRLLADQAIAKAKGENSLEVSLTANFGTQQTASKLADAYRNPQSQQYIGATLDVPLLDWGYRKSQIRLAKANKELVEVNTQQYELNFEQDIYMQVLNFNQQKNQVLIAQKIDSVAEERMNITKERYLLGKLDITDLNLALQESVNAKQGYIEALKNYWVSFYTLRRLTLYDFLNKKTLKYKIDF